MTIDIFNTLIQEIEKNCLIILNFDEKKLNIEMEYSLIGSKAIKGKSRTIY